MGPGRAFNLRWLTLPARGLSRFIPGEDSREQGPLQRASGSGVEELPTQLVKVLNESNVDNVFVLYTCNPSTQEEVGERCPAQSNPTRLKPHL